MERVCADEGEILGAEFIGGCSARLGDLVDTAPHLIDPPLLAAIRRVSSHARRPPHSPAAAPAAAPRDLAAVLSALRSAADAGDAMHRLGHRARRAARARRRIVWSYFTYPFNLTGQPAGSLPCGLGPDDFRWGCSSSRRSGRSAPGRRHARHRGDVGPACPTPIEPVPKALDPNALRWVQATVRRRSELWLELPKNREPAR